MILTFLKGVKPWKRRTTPRQFVFIFRSPAGELFVLDPTNRMSVFNYRRRGLLWHREDRRVTRADAMVLGRRLADELGLNLLQDDFKVRGPVNTAGLRLPGVRGEVMVVTIPVTTEIGDDHARTFIPWSEYPLSKQLVVRSRPSTEAVYA